MYNPFSHSTTAALRECRKEPRKCFAHLMLDGAVIIAAYGLLVWLIDGQSLQVANAAKFYALFLFLAFVLRYLDVDFSDQLTRVAGLQIGSKLFAALVG